MSTPPEPENGLSPVKRALLALKEMQARLDEHTRARNEPIAIVGMSCRFPGGVRSPEDYWELLRNGVDAISEVPAERWDADAFYDPDAGKPGKMNTRWGGFMRGVADFDAPFFGITPREATRIDPQQRLMLEVAWEALEDAGQPPDALAGSATGVFVGLYNHDYSLFQIGNVELIDAYTALGNSHSVTANRVSYFLDLRGPSVAVDTACSSSLVAVHMACHSLRSGECDMALAGGTNVMIRPQGTMVLSSAGTTAPDGRCKTFDAAADGIALGEGCGVIVLKRLSDAQAAGDHILALVRGSAVNQDGRTNGLTAPNGLAQQAVIRQALQAAGVRPERVGYVEAHGTGTALGDPIEVEALAAALGGPRPSGPHCHLGSVKTNFGHLEAAAGVAGLIKAVLCLRHREIAPNLHFTRLNPYIRLDQTPFLIPTRLTEWRSEGGPRVAGVSSFGFGGTNAHVILEEAPEAPAGESADATAGESAGVQAEAVVVEESRPRLLPVSARGPEALRALASSYAELLDGAGNREALRDVCHSAALHRSHLEQRLSVIASSPAQAARRLRDFAAGELSDGLFTARTPAGARPRLALVFPGQGAQWAGMGAGLLRDEPAFRRAAEECAEALAPHCDWSLWDVLRGGEEAAALLERIDVVQPSLFAVQVSLWRLWRWWGVEPDAVIGHSMGEVAAAHAAGALSLEEAAEVICARSTLLRQVSGRGAMAVVELSREEVERTIEGLSAGTGAPAEVGVAASNGTRSTVVSGSVEAVAQLLQGWEARGLFCRAIKSDVAGHGPQLDPLVEPLRRRLQHLRPRRGTTPMLSTVTGEWLGGEELGADYWARNMREEVRFRDAARRLTREGYGTFVEVSPHPLLGQALAEAAAESGAEALVTGALRRDADEREEALRGLGAIWCAGRPVAWERANGAGGRRVKLPAYPWQHARYWMGDEEAVSKAQRRNTHTHDAAAHPLLGGRVRSALSQILFEARLDAESPAYLGDHRVLGVVVLPAAAYVEMALSAASALNGGGSAALTDLTISTALAFPDEQEWLVQTVLTPEADGRAAFEVYSAEASDSAAQPAWTKHAAGRLVPGPGVGAPAPLAELRERCREEFPVEEYYRRLHERGLQYGPGFRAIRRLRGGDDESLALLSLPEELRAGAAAYRFHPALLDACFQVVGAALAGAQGPRVAGGTYLPVGVAAVRCQGRPDAGQELWCHARVRRPEAADDDNLYADVSVFDAAGLPLLEAEGLHLKRSADEVLRQTIPQDVKEWLYEVEWRAAARRDDKTQEAPPDYLPDTAEIAGRVQARVDGSGAAASLDSYRAAKSLLDRLSAGYAFAALRQLGWEPRPASRFTAAGLAEGLGVAEKYRRLLARMLEMLAEDGLLRRDGDAWEVTGEPAAVETPPESDDAWRELTGRSPVCAAELSLLRRCGEQLARSLRGECDPLQLLFPDGSTAAVEGVYVDSPAARFYNELVLEAVACAAGRLPRGRTLRVLEVGGGTASTSSYALSALPEGRTAYVFSDVSSLFLLNAESKLRGWPFVEYRTLDIEADVEGQGFAPHSFDLVIAANVLHATADLRATLSNVARLLADEGLLLLLEATAPQRWVDLTFGLTDGWWRFEDESLRPSYPLLARGRWLELLGESGFTSPEAMPRADDGSVLSEQSLIAARGPRVGRQAEGGDEARDAWLLFADRGGVARALASRLEARGERCVLVSAGDVYGRGTGGNYELCPTRPDEFRRLLDGDGGAARWRGVLHLWGLDAPAAETTTADDLRAAQSHACASALHLVQALAQTSAQTRLWVVTRGAQQAGAPGSCVAAAQATLWGLGRVAALEHPELWGGMLDLDPDAAGDPEEEARLLLSEVAGPACEENQVAWRGGERRVARLARSEPAAAEPVKVSAEGSYLVTGGAGGLGLATARWLFERGARHLALAARSEPSAHALGAAEELRRAGAEVLFLRGDVARGGDVAAWLAQVGASLPPLRGVVHAAGVLDDAVLMNQEWGRFERVLAPKVDGAWHLHAQTLRLPLDFFVLYSSAAALLGSPGQANHAAANAFLDSLAHYRRGLGLPALSVNWGVWSDIGAAAGLSVSKFVSMPGVGVIAPAQGFEALAQVFGAPAAQVGVLPVNWETWRVFNPSSYVPPLLSELLRPGEAQAPAAGGATRDAIMSARREERLALVEDYLRRLVARILRLPDAAGIDVARPLTTLGLDSLMAIEMRSRIQTDLGLLLTIADFLKGPTVAKLSAHLLEQLTVQDISAGRTGHAGEAESDTEYEVVKI